MERPASVVKELLENALDAGADRVDIQIEGDGTRLIRVQDNGMGMDQDDVLLCLERHATSKLTEESQLNAIATLGFRGEALPSIASVSRMTILSRIRDAAVGTQAEIRYGVFHDVHENGCAHGTIIEVRSLFGSLPARRKFLKTKRTELSHIEEIIRSQSLAHPEIAFALFVDGRCPRQVNNSGCGMSLPVQIAAPRKNGPTSRRFVYKSGYFVSITTSISLLSFACPLEYDPNILMLLMPHFLEFLRFPTGSCLFPPELSAVSSSDEIQ